MIGFGLPDRPYLIFDRKRMCPWTRIVDNRRPAMEILGRARFGVQNIGSPS
jgi:hypothetical protein